MSEGVNPESFEVRKKDHIRISLMEASQSKADSDWHQIQLLTEAMPEIDFSEIQLTVQSLGRAWSTPFFVSSMTGGHSESFNLNSVLAEACSSRQWLLGVGSQRRELEDSSAAQEWTTLRRKFPSVMLASNLGISQLIKTSLGQVQRLIDSTEAVALFIHLNALQECVQLEGTPYFKGGYAALESLANKIQVPIIVKEVGSGISASTVAKLRSCGVGAVDVSGRGGTHWGRVEGLRAPMDSPQARAAETFADWGLSTPRSLLSLSSESYDPLELWASGGIRNGLQAAKCLALGAKRIGLARPFLEAALKGPEAVLGQMDQLEYELKISLFCLGIKDINEFKQRKVWVWEKA